MAERISVSKGFDDDAFDTYVPELEEAADIRNALELFFYGNSEDGNATGDVSLHATLVDFDTRISQNDSSFDGHTGAISDVHGVGAGNLVVGTGTTQTLTNKTIVSPIISTPTINAGVSGALSISSTEIGHLDGVTSSIQTQINTNTPTGMIVIHSGSTAPTGWLLCDGASYALATYSTLFSTIGYTFGGSGSAFAVPNLKGKIVVGIDPAQTEFDTRGETGGAMTHQHASSNSGTTNIAHNHAIDPPSTGSSGAGDHGHSLTDHSHYSDHSHYADHSHSINPGETGTSSSSHSHTVNANSSNASRGTGTSGVALASHTHGTDANSHSHNVNIATFTSANANGSGVTTGNSNYGNTSGANALSTSTNSGNHSHSVDISAFNTSGGEGGSHAHTTPVSDSLSNLQPYIALNYIIKI
jgi:microcystin-dependent protein